MKLDEIKDVPSAMLFLEHLYAEGWRVIEQGPAGEVKAAIIAAQRIIARHDEFTVSYDREVSAALDPYWHFANGDLSKADFIHLCGKQLARCLELLTRHFKTVGVQL